MCFACAWWTLNVDWSRQLSTAYIQNKLWPFDKKLFKTVICFPKFALKITKQ